jgi:hypothetical protein
MPPFWRSRKTDGSSLRVCLRRLLQLDEPAMQLLHQERRRVGRQMGQEPVQLIDTPDPALPLAEPRRLGAW